MSNLYVVTTENRNVPNCLRDDMQGETATGNSHTQREFKSISLERVKIIQEAKIREQEKLWEQLNVRDSKKLKFVTPAHVLIPSEEKVSAYEK